MTTPNIIRIRYAIAGVNGTLLLLYLWVLDFPSHTLRLAIYALLCLCILALALARSSGILGQSVQNLQLSLLGICGLFLSLETLRFAPQAIPQGVRDYLMAENLPDIRTEVVEYLDRSPYVKFRPHVTVRTLGYRGTPEQFVYEWKTDRFGFRNPDAIAALKRVELVALGDSFTEGTGVAIADTWPSILSAEGVLSYNLGVQTYAPIQLEGAYREYGRRLGPRWIVIGYCATTHVREAAFFDEQRAIRDRRFTGGIWEIRHASRHLTTALYLFAVDTMYRFAESRLIAQSAGDIVTPVLARYTGEVNSAATIVSASTLETSPTFNRTLEAFSRIKKMADEQGARVMLLYLPQRGDIYFQRAIGLSPPEQRLHAVESALLSKFSGQNGIVFVDPTRALREYVNTLPGSASIDQYPYLEIDGHMNPIGHRLVAAEVLAALRGQ